MDSTAFAWMDGRLICGLCQYAMDDTVSRKADPVEYRVCCRNSGCRNYGRTFKPIYPQIVLQDITDRVLQEPS